MELMKRIFRALKDLFFPCKSPLDRWAEEIEMEAYERGELDL